MRYILTFFLIVLVSSSEIINKSDEIKEFGNNEVVKLQVLSGIIPYIGKVYTAGTILFTSAKAYMIGTKVFKFAKNFINVNSKIFKGANNYIIQRKALIEESKIFILGKKTFDKGRAIYNKYIGMIRNVRLDKRTLGVIDKVKLSEIYQTYQKMRDTYNKAKNIYDKIKSFYEISQDVYKRFPKKDKTPEEQLKTYQEEEKYRTQAYQAQQQRLKLIEKRKRQERLVHQKNQIFQLYAQLRSNNTMTLAKKEVEINNHFNYMLNK